MVGIESRIGFPQMPPIGRCGEFLLRNRSAVSTAMSRVARRCDSCGRRVMPTPRIALRLLAVIAFFAFPVANGWAQTSPDSLQQGFQNPPQSARPRVWWHWMNGNITREGIQLDLDWMHRVGIAGFQNFDAALDTPQVVEKRLAYMTPEWKEAFQYAIHLGDHFGMEMAIAGSPGWSESGGPWVPPSQGMKKYVWSATPITGGKPFTGKLAHRPSNTGAFQNLRIHDPDGDAPKGAKP